VRPGDPRDQRDWRIPYRSNSGSRSRRLARAKEKRRSPRERDPCRTGFETSTENPDQATARVPLTVGAGNSAQHIGLDVSAFERAPLLAAILECAGFAVVAARRSAWSAHDIVAEGPLSGSSGQAETGLDG